MSTQRILRATTQSLVTYPRVGGGAGGFVVGVPSSPEVRVGTPASSFADEDGAWDSGTVDSTNVAVTVAGAVGDTSLTVASMTAIAGRKYLVVDVDGTIVVTAAKSGTGTTLYLTEPLERTISTNASVKGWAITRALTTAQTDIAGTAIAVFRATVDSVVYTWSHPFRVVRRFVVVPLTAAELSTLYPIAHSLKPPTSTFEEVIESAWEMRVLPRLAARNVREEDIVDTDVMRPVLAAACILQLAMMARDADPQWRADLAADFDRVVETAFSRHDWHDEPQSSDPPLEAAPARRRMGLRVTR